MKRNREKGFTLIELLAVIVILAIIALITVPIILNVIYKAEKGAFEDAAYGVIDAGRLHFTESLADTNSFTGKTFDFGSKDHGLKISGEKPGGGTLVLDGEGNQTLAIYDTKKRWCALKEKEEHKVKVEDYNASKCEGGTAPTPTSTPTPTPPSGEGGGSIVDDGTVSTGDGLYENPDNVGGGWVYKGANPNNLLIYDNKCFSVIAIDKNKEIKIIYEGTAVGNTCTGVRTGSSGQIGKTVTWNTAATNNWYDSNTLMRTTLEKMSVDKSFLQDTSKISTHSWNVGAVYLVSGQTLVSDMQQEKNQKSSGTGWPVAGPYTWDNKIGLINGSDYIKASTNSSCTGYYAAYSGTSCGTGNYLMKTLGGYWYWTLNAEAGNYYGIFTVVTKGKFSGNNGWSTNIGNGHTPRPTMYLNSNVTITGTGAPATPFLVS